MPKRSIDEEEASTAHNNNNKMNHDSKTTGTGTQADSPLSFTPSIKFHRYRNSQATSSSHAEDVVPIPTFSFNTADNARSPATTSTGSGSSSSNRATSSASTNNAAVTPQPHTQVAVKREKTDASPISTKSLSCKEEFSKLLLESLQSPDGNIVASVLEDLAFKIKACPPADVLEHFLLLGGHTLLALALTKWKSNQAVQAMGCCCIVRVISWAKVHNNDDDNGDRLGGMASKSVDLIHLVGGIDLATHALKTFPSRPKVQYYGLAAIGNLLHPEKETDVHRVAAKRFVEQLDGITTITKAMAAFPKREMVQEIALWVLKRLGELGMGRSAQLKEKAIVLVATAAQKFPQNQEIDEFTRAFMKDAFSRDY